MTDKLAKNNVHKSSRKKTFLPIAVGFLIICIFLVAVNYFAIGRSAKFIITETENTKVLTTGKPMVGIVFGGGIEDGKPRPTLKDRLDAGAELLTSKKVRKLIVSGDNRFVNYNEPQAMKTYLVEVMGIDPSLIQLDNAGRSTYETCERASKIFGLKKAVLISQDTHLPRAIYTCRSFGIESYGYASDGKASSGLQIGQRLRELLARTKATINIYIKGEQTILGNKIKV